MKKYKVIWEVQKYVSEVEAENEEKAIEIVMNGNMGDKIFEGEITVQPEAFEK